MSTSKIAAGQTIALVGMSGGGKSTLVRPDPALLRCQEGQIAVDGVDVPGAIKLHALRAEIGLVSQHTFLFNDTDTDQYRLWQR